MICLPRTGNTLSKRRKKRIQKNKSNVDGEARRLAKKFGRTVWPQVIGKLELNEAERTRKLIGEGIRRKLLTRGTIVRFGNFSADTQRRVIARALGTKDPAITLRRLIRNNGKK
ncbi:MAG: hypothetical protein JW772_01685 [Candidatus Diapherotrites archaeon]|nr:hypothetical protein [Candidatus Diapherotrites archaeon]